MIENDDQKYRWMGFIALILAFLGMLVSIGGALSIFTSQVEIQGASLWPLPALILLDWALLGLAGFLGAYFSARQMPARWLQVAWTATGALLPLVILGAFSIGPLVLIGLLFFLASAILNTFQKDRQWLKNLGLLMAGAVVNLTLLLLLIFLGNLNFRG